MSASCALTFGFNHGLELDEVAGTAPRSPLIVGDSCPQQPVAATVSAGGRDGSWRSLIVMAAGENVEMQPAI